MKCEHRPMSAFKNGAHWRCSGCGTVAAWSDTWSRFGAIACHKCGQEPVIEFVACSDTCRAQYGRETSDLQQRERAERVERELSAIDEQLAVLQRRRHVLQRLIRRITL